MKKYLFLDFDGVCNRVGDGSYMSYAETGRYGLSTYCCTQIRRICEETGAKIIISSNWRKFDDDGYWIYNGVKFNNPIRQIDGILGEFIVGILPKIRHANKYVALIEWFKKNNIEFNDIKWAVLDDDIREELFRCGRHYFQTDPNIGVDEAYADKIINYLNG